MQTLSTTDFSMTRQHAAEGSHPISYATLPNWLDQLRKVEIVERVLNDPRSTGDTLFGMDSNQAFSAINGGQTDFDRPQGNLSPEDLVLLYAYLNQKGHLEELITAFSQLFADSAAKPRNPVVVDLGCGPFTGGLALAATFGHDPCFDYIGIDRADSMRRLGERLAHSSLVPGRVTTHWAAGINALQWQDPPGWREVIVIISYLFASPTLDVKVMFEELDSLLRQLGHGAVTLLYTNSIREELNRQYPGFRQSLERAGFQAWADDQGEIAIERRSGLQERKLRYALFRRPERQILSLGE